MSIRSSSKILIYSMMITWMVFEVLQILNSFQHIFWCFYFVSGLIMIWLTNGCPIWAVKHGVKAEREEG
jgi:hypothetical protein